MIEYEQHIVLVFLRNRQVFGELLEESAHLGKVQFDLDDVTLTEWISKDDYFVWNNIYHTVYDDIDEVNE